MIDRLESRFGSGGNAGLSNTKPGKGIFKFAPLCLRAVVCLYVLFQICRGASEHVRLARLFTFPKSVGSFDKLREK